MGVREAHGMVKGKYDPKLKGTTRTTQIPSSSEATRRRSWVMRGTRGLLEHAEERRG